MDFATAGPVKFAEENALPAAEYEMPVFDRYGLRNADQSGLYVRIGVAFVVLVRGAVWHKFIESFLDIVRHVRVVAFVYRNRGSRMRDVQVAGSCRNPGTRNPLADLSGDIHQFGAPRSFEAQRLKSGFGRGFGRLAHGQLQT